ncbi:transcriptional regulator [Pedobacter antarcticus 4BY]|uniref:Transcriptional regulator n=2 Tax=Pedobacter antarcticus TaxID=34086 RepID=A0A081PCG8_9SPHI|nr:FMN-binding negative transcriptional regulator [Pedobacter antarcticus]KEQ28391.1 transcriptional regulator [Pedobacter antarcticus 4BY]SFF05133.1 negative transcriptional regulator, PaiB family [Pedobacter antarcticus]
MYIPNGFQFDNDDEKVAFMKQYSFATIITTKDNFPIATQLPFLVEKNSDKLVLSSHFALANEQAKIITENISLVIFTEPHAYISPKHYEKRESVPTWDYIAVHAYGKAKILDDETSKLKILERMIHFYEKDYLQQWDGLTEKFRTGMMRGIVAFELEVSDLQGQKKLSQNKTVVERDRIIEQLENGGNTVEKDLAKYIREENK